MVGKSNLNGPGAHGQKKHLSYAQVLLFVEIRGRKTIPVIHYVLVSLALILFFSLLTALSEQLGFNAAYLAASVATIVLISLFTALVVKDKKRPGWFLDYWSFYTLSFTYCSP